MCSLKMMFLQISQNSQENTYKKETIAQVFSCEFCEISKNIFFTEHLWATASDGNQSNELLFKAIDVFVYDCTTHWFYMS